ncbi:hypothetical protein ACVW01_000345 [Thermostichus sp. MS-CIW-19]
MAAFIPNLQGSRGKLQCRAIAWAVFVFGLH